MSYFRYKIEKSAAKGAGGLMVLVLQVCAFLLVFFWPLGITMTASGKTTASGWIFEGAWLLALAGLFITFRGRRRKS